MALTVTKQADPATAGTEFVIGDRKLIFAQVTFDSSYPTGGEPVTPAMFGLETQVDWVVPLLANAATVARFVTYDRANKKLMLFATTFGEVANASDQSTISVPCLVIGK